VSWYIEIGCRNLYTDIQAWIHYLAFAVLRNPNLLYCCYLLELWQPCYILTPGDYILGGGIVTLAQRIQNGFRKILQVCLHISSMSIVGLEQLFFNEH
jgi:hypothetical protein